MRRNNEARQAYISAVRDVVKDLEKDYDHELAKAMIPHMRNVTQMTNEEVDRLMKRRRKPPAMEAAE